jgi:hypothetical protein
MTAAPKPAVYVAFTFILFLLSSRNQNSENQSSWRLQEPKSLHDLGGTFAPLRMTANLRRSIPTKMSFCKAGGAGTGGFSFSSLTPDWPHLSGVEKKRHF